MINRDKVLQQAQSGEERQLFSRISDLAEHAEKRETSQFSHFLTPAEQAAIARVKEFQTETVLKFDGGYENAERKLAVLSPLSTEEVYTLPVLAFEILSKTSLSHRDILGAVLALGIKRETVGDILDTNQPPILLTLETMEDFLLTNFVKAGHGQLSLRQISLSTLVPAQPTTKDIIATVASLRLDAVLSEGFSISRGAAADAIKAGRVSVNWQDVISSSKEIKEGDKISLKGMGKIKLEQVRGLSRKNRIFITIKRYI